MLLRACAGVAVESGVHAVPPAWAQMLRPGWKVEDSFMLFIALSGNKGEAVCLMDVLCNKCLRESRY